MKPARIRILVVMALLLIGMAGLVHSAMEQFGAQAAPYQHIGVEQTLQEVQAEVAAIAEVSRLASQTGGAGTSGAPTAPPPPAPPAPPTTPVDLTMWLTLTLACFAPFALAGWYFDRRARATIAEQPLP